MIFLIFLETWHLETWQVGDKDIITADKSYRVAQR